MLRVVMDEMESPGLRHGPSDEGALGELGDGPLLGVDGEGARVGPGAERAPPSDHSIFFALEQSGPAGGTRNADLRNRRDVNPFFASLSSGVWESEHGGRTFG